MANNIEIATGLLNDFTETKVKELFEHRPWMEGKKFLLLTKPVEVEEYINKCIDNGLATLDVETTGLNNRLDPNGQPYIKLVGICLSCSPDEGAYVPVGHEDKEFNVPLKIVLKEVARLCANCRCIFHNFKYDGEVLRNLGIIIEEEDKYEDTLLLAAVYDASMKKKGLKDLCEGLLNRPMLEINELGVTSGKKGMVSLALVPPQKAVYYGASDGMNTYALYQFLKAKIDEQDPLGKSGPWAIYRIEKRCQFVTMEMERNYVRIDKAYLEKLKVDVIGRMKKLVHEIHALVGREFDLNSPKQLGPILFEEMKIPYPEKEKTKSGQYGTSEEVLEKLKGKYPIVDMILTYRGYGKVLNTYINNFIDNADWNDEVKFQLNQVRADTGRFSSTGGNGLHIDGYCGVNCQNIPKYKKNDPHSINLRRAIIARPGYKLVSIDYSGEELRIAANLSKEPKWIEEFLHGSGDLHTITAKIITNKNSVTKEERDIGKTLNFLTLYGGGAGGFAAQAKIPYETAQKMIANFFRDYTGIKRWIATESAASRKRGYSKTAFGRRRPLYDFYNSKFKEIQAKGDRCAVNASVQGSGSDIIKIALYRVWKWIKTNNFGDDVRILIPIHDEILYEIKEDKLDAYIPEICEIMRLKDVIAKLKWTIPLEVDVEYGDSFHTDHNYWEERKELEKGKEERPVIQVQERQQIPAQDVPEKAVAAAETPIIDKQSDKVVVTTVEGSVPGITVNNEVQQYYLNVTVKDALMGYIEAKEDIKKMLEKSNERKESDPIFKDAHIKDRVDARGYFNYPVDIDPIVALNLRYIFDLLTSVGDGLFMGPKYKICLLSKDGEVYYRTPNELAIDAFLVLCLKYNI